MKLGLSGNLTRFFISSPLTPLLLIAALLAGCSRPSRSRVKRSRRSAYPWSTSWSPPTGTRPTKRWSGHPPAGRIIKGINGVEHVYSQTEDDKVVVTARFLVGTDQDTAVLRVHEKIRAALDRSRRESPNR